MNLLNDFAKHAVEHGPRNAMKVVDHAVEHGPRNAKKVVDHAVEHGPRNAKKVVDHAVEHGLRNAKKVVDHAVEHGPRNAMLAVGVDPDHAVHVFDACDALKNRDAPKLLQSTWGSTFQLEFAAEIRNDCRGLPVTPEVKLGSITLPTNLMGGFMQDLQTALSGMIIGIAKGPFMSTVTLEARQQLDALPSASQCGPYDRGACRRLLQSVKIRHTVDRDEVARVLQRGESWKDRQAADYLGNERLQRILQLTAHLGVTQVVCVAIVVLIAALSLRWALGGTLFVIAWATLFVISLMLADVPAILRAALAHGVHWVRTKALPEMNVSSPETPPPIHGAISVGLPLQPWDVASLLATHVHSPTSHVLVNLLVSSLAVTALTVGCFGAATGCITAVLRKLLTLNGAPFCVCIPLEHDLDLSATGPAAALLPPSVRLAAYLVVDLHEAGDRMVQLVIDDAVLQTALEQLRDSANGKDVLAMTSSWEIDTPLGTLGKKDFRKVLVDHLQVSIRWDGAVAVMRIASAVNVEM